MEPPFDHRRLDELMDVAGLDAVVATSKHNVQYLLGGHRFFFFDYMDAIGVSRYLPVVIYVRNRPDLTRYIANANEAWQCGSPRIVEGFAMRLPGRGPRCSRN